MLLGGGGGVGSLPPPPPQAKRPHVRITIDAFLNPNFIVVTPRKRLITTVTVVKIILMTPNNVMAQVNKQLKFQLL
ncbi:MAG: hypothetical protein ACJAW1_001065 [Glaciecola sp.]